MKIFLAAFFVFSMALSSFSADIERIRGIKIAEISPLSADRPDAPVLPDPVPQRESNGTPAAVSTFPVVYEDPKIILNNISNNQNLIVGKQIRIEGRSTINLVKISLNFNNEPLGDAVLNGNSFYLKYSFANTSDFGRLELVGYNDEGIEAARATYYVNVVQESDLEGRYFSPYILKAVDWLAANYGLLGYDIKAVLTHDIDYHTFGTIAAVHPPRTMCVAAQLEIILTAYKLYSQETGDYSVYDYLPKTSYEDLGPGDLKGHIWVNHDFHSYGTADALINFGMGERTTFDKLKPGSFVNLNRTNRTGHAVVFIGYIDVKGNILPEYNSDAVGFKYFSAQGRAAAGRGGFDYRYAFFRKHGCPRLKAGMKRDCKVIYSTSQNMLNTGTMLAPKFWRRLPPESAFSAFDRKYDRSTIIDQDYFNGITTDD